MNMMELLETSPVIAAVKSEDGLKAALESDCQVIFLLFGSICDVDQLVDRIKEKDRTAVVHVDFIAGLNTKEVAVEFIRKNTHADGIICTKAPLVKHARELGLLSIQRTFVVDSIALSMLKKQIDAFHPDAVEIMPGVMPKILKEIREYTNMPLIAGGLLSDKKDVMAAFAAGADAVSTTRQELWYV